MNAQEALSCLVLSIPRAGTHFLMKTLALMGLKEYAPPGGIGVYNLNRMPRLGHFEYGGHFALDMEPVVISLQAGYKPIFIYRDPRDVIVSHAIFAIKDARAQGGHPVYPAFDSGDMDEAIRFLIQYTPLRYDARMGWLQQPHVLSIKYEDLLMKPHETINAISMHLGDLELSGGEVNLIVSQMAPTRGGEADKISAPYFSKGKVGDWKNWFKPYHVALFKEFAPDLLLDLGYETHDGW